MSFRPGQFIWVDFGAAIGHEQAGRRPALVVSPESYNNNSSFVLICPVTNSRKPWPWKVFLPQDSAIGGAILVDQLKSIDQATRHIEVTQHLLGAEPMRQVRTLLQRLLLNEK